MKKPWSPADIALAGVSALACAVIFFGTYLLIVGVGNSDIGWGALVLLVLTWASTVISGLALVVAAIAKTIGIGVRSAND